MQRFLLHVLCLWLLLVPRLSAQELLPVNPALLKGPWKSSWIAAPQAAQRNAAGAPAESGLGTGHGRSVASAVRHAEFERATEAPEEIIAIYYDSYDNLLARGVIPAPRRDPRPFPGSFVPDPPRG